MRFPQKSGGKDKESNFKKALQSMLHHLVNYSSLLLTYILVFYIVFSCNY